MENQSEFVQFLIRAKKNTYAGDGTLSAASRPASKDLKFEQGDYLYLDTYLGSVDFIGEEAVWHRQEPVWGMNYYGMMLTDEIPEGFSHCLKGALLNAPIEAPYRGPARFQEAAFEYTCQWKGDLEHFEGAEQIFLNGKQIYQLSFHGGSVK
jgi:hypothetical protein